MAAIKFQYNKTSQQALNKQLNVRINALPTLKNKEAALRVEVIKAKDEANKLKILLKEKYQQHQKAIELWEEFDNSLVSVEDVALSVKKIAGVKTPVLEKVHFKQADFSIFNNPIWFLDAIEIIKEMTSIALEQEVFIRKTELLNYARRKTTQKVNLYEKVQIPGFQEAILKIKRYLEDEENLSKSAQKIVKNRINEMEESAV